MTQKMMIKTAVNRVSQPQTIEYQWHWQRIFIASGMVLLAASLLFYGLTKSVNADEVNIIDEQKNTTKVLSPDVKSAVHKIADKGQPAKAEPKSQNTFAQLINEAKEAQNKVTSGPVINVPLNDTSPLGKVETHEEKDGLAEKPISNTKQTEVKPFGNKAKVASVDLGAQIDTNTVSRAVLTSAVSQREPVNVLGDSLTQDEFDTKLYFFTEIRNLQGQTIQHLWFHQDQLMAEVPLSITATRHRTYSSKNIMPSQTGQWRVEVVSVDGQLLAQKSFRIIPKTF